MTSGAKKFVIAVYGPLGGQGVSFIASQLVHQLARFGPSCLLDLNLDHSTGLQYLNQEPAEAFRKSALASGDSVQISSFAIKIENNYFAVGAPLLGYGQFAEETRDSVKDLFDLCRAEFDYTVIDMPRPLHVELTKSALSMSDLVLSISENTGHSARACIKLKQLLVDPGVGLDAKKFLVLFNNSVTQNLTALQIVALQAMMVVLLLIVVYLFMPGLLTNPMFIAFFIMLVLLMALPKTIPSRMNTNNALSLLSKKQISVFHQLPQDSRSCRMVINEGTFLDEKTRIGMSLIGLAEKLKTRLSKTS